MEAMVRGITGKRLTYQNNLTAHEFRYALARMLRKLQKRPRKDTLYIGDPVRGEE